MTPKARLTQLHHQFHTHQRRINEITYEMERLAKELIEGGYRAYYPNDTFDEFAISDEELNGNLFVTSAKWTNVVNAFIDSGYEEKEEEDE